MGRENRRGPQWSRDGCMLHVSCRRWSSVARCRGHLGRKIKSLKSGLSLGNGGLWMTAEEFVLWILENEKVCLWAGSVSYLKNSFSCFLRNPNFVQSPSPRCSIRPPRDGKHTPSSGSLGMNHSWFKPTGKSMWKMTELWYLWDTLEERSDIT